MFLSKKIILGITIIVISLLLTIGCSGSKTETAGGERKAISVQGEAIVPVTRELVKSFTGNLEGRRQAVIRAKIAEAVEKIDTREGDHVASGDPIISLDKTGPTSNYMQAYSVYQNSEKNYNKMKYLYDQGAISESQFDGARTEYEVSHANFDAALQMVELRSPITGTVTSIDVAVGEYVSPGMQVATVAETGDLRMKFGVSSSDIGYISDGADVRVSVEADSLLVGKGNVIMVARSADPVTRTFEVEVEVENAGRQFKPGMFAKGDITVGTYNGIVAVPREAVINRSGKDYVFVYSGGKALQREVTLGIDFNGTSEVRSGLIPGDTLITVGQNYLEDGVPVNLAKFVTAEGKEVEL